LRLVDDEAKKCGGEIPRVFFRIQDPAKTLYLLKLFQKHCMNVLNKSLFLGAVLLLGACGSTPESNTTGQQLLDL
jgi:hypothetical protein